MWAKGLSERPSKNMIRSLVYIAHTRRLFVLFWSSKFRTSCVRTGAKASLLTNKWCFPKFTWLQDGYNIRMLSEFSGFSLVIYRAVVVCISERQFSPPGFRCKQPFPRFLLSKRFLVVKFFFYPVRGHKKILLY